jgi:hypothetical protein
VSEQTPQRPDEAHPIITGIVALVGVGLAVGLILGLVVLAGSRVLGLGGDSDTGTAGSDRSMYLPKPEKTPTSTAPASTPTPEKPTSTASPRRQITLSASSTTAGPMETFGLTGVYPGGEGAILQVQRFTAGTWQDFPVTASVGNETFQTSVATSQPGPNRFRVVDTDTGLESNEVRVTIG